MNGFIPEGVIPGDDYRIVTDPRTGREERVPWSGDFGAGHSDIPRPIESRPRDLGGDRRDSFRPIDSRNGDLTIDASRRSQDFRGGDFRDSRVDSRRRLDSQVDMRTSGTRDTFTGGRRATERDFRFDTRGRRRDGRFGFRDARRMDREMAERRRRGESREDFLRRTSSAGRGDTREIRRFGMDAITPDFGARIGSSDRLSADRRVDARSRESVFIGGRTDVRDPRIDFATRDSASDLRRVGGGGRSVGERRIIDLRPSSDIAESRTSSETGRVDTGASDSGVRIGSSDRPGAETLSVDARSRESTFLGGVRSEGQLDGRDRRLDAPPRDFGSEMHTDGRSVGDRTIIDLSSSSDIVETRSSGDSGMRGSRTDTDFRSSVDRGRTDTFGDSRARERFADSRSGRRVEPVRDMRFDSRRDGRRTGVDFGSARISGTGTFPRPPSSSLGFPPPSMGRPGPGFPMMGGPGVGGPGMMMGPMGPGGPMSPMMPPHMMGGPFPGMGGMGPSFPGMLMR